MRMHMCLVVLYMYVGLSSRLFFLWVFPAVFLPTKAFFVLVFPLGLVGLRPLNIFVCVCWPPVVKLYIPLCILLLSIMTVVACTAGRITFVVMMHVLLE